MENITVKARISDKYETEVISSIKTEMKNEIFHKVATEMPENTWFAIRLRVAKTTNYIMGPADPLAPPELIANLEIKPVQDEYVKIVSPAFVNYKRQKGFWKRLKLLFSRKAIYTEETR